MNLFALLFFPVLVLAPLAAPAESAAQDAKPAPASATMKAVRIHAYGTAQVLHLEDAPRPVAKKGQLLVKVFAAGVNPVDYKIRSGAFGGGALTAPMILGYDVSGVVEAVGEEVTAFKVGDEVFAYLALQRGGGYAEYAIVSEKEAAKKPKELDHVHAAAVPLACLTAQQALFDTAALAKGQTVLIHAGAGGVGHFAVQLAKARGARVIATASGANGEFLKKLGADVVVDYKTQKFEDFAKDVDVVFDSIGGDTLARSYACVRTGGFVVSIVAPPDAAQLKERGARGKLILVKPDGKQLGDLAALIDAHQLTPTVSRVFPLADVAQAHAESETGHTRGKLVLKVR